jgi:hypothetical protein
MQFDCEVCERLWREYAVAAASHIPLESKILQAAKNRDFARIAALSRRVEAAVMVRSERRERIRRHEAAAHSKGATGGVEYS